MHRSTLLIFMLYCAADVFANDTVLNLYRPFADNELSMTEHQKGRCLHQSLRIQREDAWHCVTHTGVVHDPCFSKRFGSKWRVVCVDSPWASSGIPMTLDTPLDEGHQTLLDMSRTLPWAIELNNGERCWSVESQQTYDGLSVRYQCLGDVVLLGDAHRCSPVWTILRRDGREISLVEIVKVWF